jgi:medium-chain acyl-[acyl-carrier-protein] hydrolase
MGELTDDRLISFSNFKITSADTDMQGRIRLGSLVNLFLQSAIDSADNLGFGFRGIRQQNLFWVLSRLTIEIDRPLIWYETVEVETWPKNVEKILYLRDFILRDRDGKITGRATSGWLAVDIVTKQLKKIDGINSEFFVRLKNRHAISSPPEKLFPADGDESFEIKTGYYDADLNKHVTTTRYVDWMMDTFPLQFHKDYYPKKMSLNIMKETMPGEFLKLIRKESDNRVFNFEGINIDRTVNAFRACIEF